MDNVKFRPECYAPYGKGEFREVIEKYMFSSEMSIEKILGRADMTIKELNFYFKNPDELTKKTIFKLCFAMNLNWGQVADVLEHSGFFFTDDPFDRCIKDQLGKEHCDIVELETLIREYTHKSLYDFDVNLLTELNNYLAENYKYDEHAEDNLEETLIKESINKDEDFSINLNKHYDELVVMVDGEERDVNIKVGPTFGKVLCDIIEQKHMTDPQVYKACDIRRQSFNKVINEDKSPGKPMIYKLAFGLQLSFDDIKKLMHAAGKSFSPGDLVDQIAKFYFINNKFDLIDFEDTLRLYGVGEKFLKDW